MRGAVYGVTLTSYMPPRSQTNQDATAPRSPGSLVGIAEIAERLGVSRQRVIELAKRPDFPAPEDDLRSGRVWRSSAVDRWIGKHRPGGRAGAASP